MGVLTVADLGTVTLLTEVWCGLRETWDMMDKHSRLSYTEKMGEDGNKYYEAKSSPAAVQYNNLLTQYRAFSAMFGLDPMSRPRLKVEKGKDVGEFAEFLGK
jgi:P27 family predicted phage terminase small subunit